MLITLIEKFYDGNKIMKDIHFLFIYMIVIILINIKGINNYINNLKQSFN